MQRQFSSIRWAALASAAALVVGMLVSVLVPSASAGVAAPAKAAAADGWTGTWSVSPVSGGPSYNQQTLRQIVHTSIGGTSARVRLSNVFGSKPLVVADVHIAQSGSGSTVSTGTDRAVTFGGATSVTVPVGGTAVSDSVGFAVTALSNVAVSVYLPQSTGPVTYHPQGTQTNYLASGDVSGSATLSGAATTGSYSVLTNLDVQNPAAEGAVVTLGASITDGVASSQGSNRRWPNDLAVRLSGAGRTIGVLNQGISGNNLLADASGQSALNRFSRDVLGQPGVRWVIFSDDPINDLGSGNPPSSDQLIAGLKQLISSAHQNGVGFLCSTLTPFQGSGGWSQNGETSRAAIDSFIRSSASGCDGVIDQDAATHDPADPTRYLPAYDSGDHLHPNEAGLQAIADTVNLNLFGTASTPPPAAPVVSLRSHANGLYVAADTAGLSPLIADSGTIDTAEEFDELDQGNGLIALRAHADGEYVTAEKAGASPLIDNRAAVGLWETFQLVHNADGSVTLKAQVNNDYVTAENAGAAPLIANRTAIGGWEEFDLVTD